MIGIIKSKTAIWAITVLIFILISGLLAPMIAHAATNTPKITVKQVFAVSEDTFMYSLKPFEEGTPMPIGSMTEGYIFTITGNRSVEIELPNFDQQGIYRYKLFQIIRTEKPDYAYDKRVYTVEVYVGELFNVEIIIKNQDNKKVNSIEFENSRKVSPSDPMLMVDPPVRKTVIGNPGKDSIFKFRLVAQNLSNSMPSGSINGVKEITITGSGEGEFGTWSYDKAGVYYYTISEVNSGEKDYSYDTTVYTITDTVKEENGQLVLSRVITNGMNKPITSCSFINNYTSSGGGGDGKPGGPKTGDDMDPGLYTTLLAIGGVLTVGVAIYLFAGGKHKSRIRYM